MSVVCVKEKVGTVHVDTGMQFSTIRFHKNLFGVENTDIRNGICYFLIYLFYFTHKFIHIVYLIE